MWAKHARQHADTAAEHQSYQMITYIQCVYIVGNRTQGNFTAGKTHSKPKISKFKIKK